MQEEAPAAHEEEDQVEAPAAHEEAEVEAPALDEMPVVEEEKEDEEQSLGRDYRSAASSSDEESEGTDEDLASNDTPARPIASSESTGITPAMRGMRLNGDCEECEIFIYGPIEHEIEEEFEEDE